MNKATKTARQNTTDQQVTYTPWSGGAMAPRSPQVGSREREDRDELHALSSLLRVAWPALSDTGREAVAAAVADDLGPDLSAELEAALEQHDRDTRAWATQGGQQRVEWKARRAAACKAAADVPWSEVETLARKTWEQAEGDGRHDLREFIELVRRQSERRAS